MELGASGMRVEGIWRQVRRGEPFVEWPEATFRLEPATRRGYLISPKAPTGSASTAVSVRLRIFVRFERPDEVLVHHPCLPRMRNTGSARVDEDWRDGPRSDLAGAAHFEMGPGEPPFAMPPLALFAHPTGERCFVGAMTERNARLAVSWGLAEGGIHLELTWMRWGRETYACSKHWPNESVWIAFDKGSATRRALEGGWINSMLKPIYLRRLSVGLGHFRPTGPLVRDELMWGSWNDGIYRDIDEARILKTAAWLKAHAPNVRWIQIDDGWAPPQNPEAPMSDFSVFYDPNRLADDPRFPGGMAGLAKKIRDLGLRPMLWLTPSVHEMSRLYLEKPEWFQPETRLYFMPELRFLDTSVAEVRTFIDAAFRTAFREWGFEGCKLDFWTMGFDQPDIAFRDPDADGESQMRWLDKSHRKYLPSDGLLLHCIDIPFGSPFRSVGFDAFRYYADSEGSCQDLAKMKEQALWAAYLVVHYQSQGFWMPDGDGLGLFRHFEMPDSHFSLWLAFLMGSGTLVELAGWLHEAENDPRREVLLRVLPHAKHPTYVETPGFDYAQRDGEPPRVWIRRKSMRSRMVALTNWSSSEFVWQAEGVPPEMEWTELVTGTKWTADAPMIVPPESGRLLVQT